MEEARRVAGVSIVADTSHAGLVRAMEEHQAELAMRWTRVQSGQVIDDPDVLVTITGLPVAYTNGARRARLRPEDATRRVTEVAQLFSDRAIPALWWVGPLSEPEGLGAVLEEGGFTLQEHMPWLAVPIEDAVRAPLPPDVEVHRVDGQERQLEWLEAMRVGFAMGPEEQGVMARLAEAVGCAEDAPWQRFVALQDDDVVASAGVMFGGGVAGIYNMSTRPWARGRGIAAGMAGVALEAARARGYRIAVLGSTPLAVPLYGRLGFRNVCKIAVYAFDGDARAG
ncbi:MAG: GNAT family N-acetyltransferase [Actinomycetota bacterium]